MTNTADCKFIFFNYVHKEHLQQYKFPLNSEHGHRYCKQCLLFLLTLDNRLKTKLLHIPIPNYFPGRFIQHPTSISRILFFQPSCYLIRILGFSFQFFHQVQQLRKKICICNSVRSTDIFQQTASRSMAMNPSKYANDMKITMNRLLPNFPKVVPPFSY